MAFEVLMPRLGWNMEVGSVAAWRKQDGDAVEAGEILFEVESEKAVQEVEALDSGILRIPADAPALGTQVPVGTLLAYLVRPGEDLPPGSQDTRVGLPERGEAGRVLSSPPESEDTHPRYGHRQHPAISPRAARVASELGLDWTALKGSGRTGRIVEKDVRRAAEALSAGVRDAKSAAPAQVSPVARRAAEELGVDLDQLASQLGGKRIERADVEQAARSPVKAAKLQAEPEPQGAVLPITPVRRLTAERLAASAHTAAPVTLTTEADATELVRLRAQLKEDSAPLVPSYTDLLVKLAAQALVEHPQLNARFEGDAIYQPESVNMGVAVDTGRGLLVPVVRGAQAKTVWQIATETAALIEQARSGRIHPGDMQGGTFTITNLGLYEIDAFTPIINLPECAILGVGRIQPKQVVIDVEQERVAIRHMLFLSLTFDHRIVDGGPAARFLQRVKQYVEKPYLWLVRS